MRDFDLQKAKEMFLNYLQWRKDYGVDAIQKASIIQTISYPFMHEKHNIDKLRTTCIVCSNFSFSCNVNLCHPGIYLY